MQGGKEAELWDKGVFMELWEDPGRSPLIWVLSSPLLLPGFDADGIAVKHKNMHMMIMYRRESSFYITQQIRLIYTLSHFSDHHLALLL